MMGKTVSPKSSAGERALTLSRVFVVSVISGIVAFFSAQPVMRQMKAHLPLQNFSSTRLEVLGYAAAFFCAFMAFGFLARHIVFSWKPQGMEITKGLVPKLARLFVSGFAFAAPLYVLKGHDLRESGISLSSLVAESEQRAVVEQKPDYKNEDRAALADLAQEEKKE